VADPEYLHDWTLFICHCERREAAHYETPDGHFNDSSPHWPPRDFAIYYFPDPHFGIRALMKELLQALALAEKGRGLCAPNPAVGAVIVDEQGVVVAEGYHHGPGLPHAEVEALRNLGRPATGMTMVVTLEPCCHHGRTPPCTEAILESGIARVVFGYSDPNPLVAGKGADQLRAAGVTVEQIDVPAIRLFYASYARWQLTKLPTVTAKIAMSLNGKIAGVNGQRIQLTGDELQVITHLARKRSDAILTTARTIQLDNPALNVRLPEETVAKNIYILDSRLSLDVNARILKTAKSITLFHAADVAPDLVARYTQLGIRCVAIACDSAGLYLPHVLACIGEEGVHDVWVEAGGRLLTALLQQQLVQWLWLYMAPIWLQEGEAAFTREMTFDARQIEWQQVGRDVVAKMEM
jgi:diaminohydroxyphosphoribosylaminopyrimidine deaminase/5-amino-6-(5-phosphoribosylamino)uracil reductase